MIVITDAEFLEETGFNQLNSMELINLMENFITNLLMQLRESNIGLQQMKSKFQENWLREKQFTRTLSQANIAKKLFLTVLLLFLLIALELALQPQNVPNSKENKRYD